MCTVLNMTQFFSLTADLFSPTKAIFIVVTALHTKELSKVVKFYFMLNLVETKIYPARKC